MVHRLNKGSVCLANRQTGPTAPYVPAENTHQDCEGNVNKLQERFTLPKKNGPLPLTTRFKASFSLWFE